MNPRCVFLKHAQTSIPPKYILLDLLTILFKSNSAWNRVCWSIHCCENHPKIPFDFDKFRLYVCSRQHYSGKRRRRGIEWLQIITKSKHTKVFLISQMWSTSPGVSLSLLPGVYASDGEVLNGFLPHTFATLHHSETLLGSGPSKRRVLTSKAAEMPSRKQCGPSPLSRMWNLTSTRADRVLKVWQRILLWQEWWWRTL